MVLIFGKENCPYTAAAVADHERRRVEFTYIDVRRDRGDMARMLEYSKGHRRVPVIVDGDKVTIGFGGT
jgi:glutaredoxin 3